MVDLRQRTGGGCGGYCMRKRDVQKERCEEERGSC